MAAFMDLEEDQTQTEQEEPLVDPEPVADDIEGETQTSTWGKVFKYAPSQSTTVTYKGAI